MKTILAILCMLAIPAYAADYTYSNVEPQIQRLQGVVLYPYEIEEIKIEDGTGYKYKLLRLKDTGQIVHQNRAVFATENRSAIAEQLYDFSDLVETQKATELDTKISVDLVAPVKKLDSKEIAN